MTNFIPIISGIFKLAAIYFFTGAVVGEFFQDPTVNTLWIQTGASAGAAYLLDQF